MKGVADDQKIEWILVPKRPTRAMIDAMKKTMKRKRPYYLSTDWASDDVKHLRRWYAALNACPQPPEETSISPHPYKP